MFSKNIDLREFSIEATVDTRDISCVEPYASEGRFEVHMKNGIVYESDYFSGDGAVTTAKKLEQRIQQIRNGE